MTTVIKYNRIIYKLLTSLILTLVILQTIYAGENENDKNNKIIVSSDGIAKMVNSYGEILSMPLNRNIKKGEIKFGGVLIDVSPIQVSKVNSNQSHIRGGKVCVNDHLNTDRRKFYLHLYDDENWHNYCLVEFK